MKGARAARALVYCLLLGCSSETVPDPTGTCLPECQAGQVCVLTLTRYTLPDGGAGRSNLAECVAAPSFCAAGAPCGCTEVHCVPPTGTTCACRDVRARTVACDCAM